MCRMRVEQQPSEAVMRKVTMRLPAALIQQAQRATGVSLTETTRMALEEITRRGAYANLLAMRGKVDLGITWQELKALRD